MLKQVFINGYKKVLVMQVTQVLSTVKQVTHGELQGSHIENGLKL